MAEKSAVNDVAVSCGTDTPELGEPDELGSLLLLQAASTSDDTATSASPRRVLREVVIPSLRSIRE
jgi:hypothetical protein